MTSLSCLVVLKDFFEFKGEKLCSKSLLYFFAHRMPSELTVIEVGIETIFGKKSFMSAFFNNRAMIHDKD